MPRLSGRMKRISAKNPEMSKGAVKRLASKRAASYTSRTAAQKSNAKRSSNLGPNQAIGRGKAGTLKRALWKAGGTRSELVALRAQPKSVRKGIKKSARTNPNYDLRGTATNMKSTRAYDSIVKKAAGWTK